MFSIFGTSGLMYRGPIESLRKVAPTLQTARIRPLQVDVDREPSGGELPQGGSPLRPGPAQAAQAYAGVQHPPAARRPLHRVADVMSTQVVQVPQGAALQVCWELLAQQGVAQAPVVDDQGRLVGLLTRAELMRPDHLPKPDDHPLVWRAWFARPVHEVMVTPVPGVSADTELRRLALLLLDTGLPGLPVVDDDGGVRGFVSRSDILKAVVHDPPLDLWAG